MLRFIFVNLMFLFATQGFAQPPNANQHPPGPALKLIGQEPEKNASSTHFTGFLLDGKTTFYRSTATGPEKVEKDFSLKSVSVVSIDCKDAGNEIVMCSLVLSDPDFGGTFVVLGKKVGDEIILQDRAFDNIPLEQNSVRLLTAQSKIILDRKTKSIARGSYLSFQDLSDSIPPTITRLDIQPTKK